MKLNTTYAEIELLLTGSSSGCQDIIDRVSIDTRSITDGEKTLFVALQGNFRDGHEFVRKAYNQGVRHFLVEKEVQLEDDCHFIHCKNGLDALQKIAANHRSKFYIPILGVTGSNGKTTVKEWLSELLSLKYKVLRSPKSYNSQLGVALSLLELRPEHEVAIIEAGISQPNEMQALETMIQPTIGIFTNLGSAHIHNFDSQESLLFEKFKLFEKCKVIYTLKENHLNDDRCVQIELLQKTPESLSGTINLKNLSLVAGIAKEMGIPSEQINSGLLKLNALANRLERFEGKNNCLIINDSYSLDITALRLSLETQLQLAGDMERVLIIGVDENANQSKQEIQALCNEFKVEKLIYVESHEKVNYEFKNACILLKGNRKTHIEKIAAELRLKKHQTYLEINLSAIRNNILAFKARLHEETKIMTMIKASSYGSDAEKMGVWLESVGVDYLGVAYVEEGLELRNKGIKLPIMVMNVHESNFTDCIVNDLEPAIYSEEQLERYITELIYLQVKHSPIHLKIETGMNRLGFIKSELPKLTSILNAQPEVYVKSIYSHLATADSDHSFAQQQIDRFTEMATFIENEVGYTSIRHILNSEGIIRFPHAQFSMVRLGIGMYGISSNFKFSKELQNALSWYSTISQIKQIQRGESVGYNRSFVADKDIQIAIVPVGYADGFSRKLGNGNGHVYINGNACSVLGNVCMDMIMVDVTNKNVKVGDSVELFGENINVETLATKLDTIPYEVFTSVSSRVTRTYIDE